MHAGAGDDKTRLDDQLRLIIVDTPETAAPLIDALDVADIGAWVWVETERSLYFSSRVLSLLGLEAEPRHDLMTRFFAGVHPEDQEPVRTLLLGAMAAGPFTMRYRFAPPNGPLRWIEDRGRVERDASGALLRQGGALRDVTLEVGRELEGREAHARLDALVNAMPFAVWERSGPNFTVRHQNAESLAVWGDMRGQGIDDAPPHVREVWKQQLADAMTGEVIRGRREYADGDIVRTVDEIIAPVVVGDRISGVVGIAIDASEEARANRFAALLTEISTDFAARATGALDEGVVRALERIARFLGSPIALLCEFGAPDDADKLVITHWWVDAAIGRDRPRALELDVAPLRPLLQRVTDNSPVVIRTRAELAGTPGDAWFAERAIQSVALVPTRHVDGVRTLLALVGADNRVIDWPADTVSCMRLTSTLLGGVLARARADAARAAMERRMQETQRLESLGVLAGGVAHDFNNLLTAILGNASLLRAELSAAEGVTDAIEQIEAASRRAAELCRQMLAYAGRGRFALQPIDLNELLRDMKHALQVSIPSNAHLELALATTLPPVLADEAQIRQLIMNLVFNAAEALQQGDGTITLRTAAAAKTSAELEQSVFSPALPPGEYVSLSVSDTGSGMTSETVARIFDPFFSTKFTGRGLGLSAVVGIVRAHKGAMQVQSALGEGSTFELLLPAHEGAATTSPVDRSPADHASLATWRTSGTALVIDDERGVRDLVRAVLERAGMTVITAESGERGVEAFAGAVDEIRVVLVDLTMPGLDGRETLAAIRQRRPEVPAILMSGYSPADLINSPAYAFLHKPFMPATLRLVLKRLLGE
jgi:signal transduction histidine kinase/CheY-like chemotaxis protein/PAS domain-containing protein